MTSERLGEMYEGDTADTCSRKFSLMSMEGRAEGLACADPGAICNSKGYSADTCAEKFPLVLMGG